LAGDIGMQRYTYTARNEYGKRVKGVIIAENEMDLANKIRNLGYFLTKAKVFSERRPTGKITPMKPKDILTFTIHLATLIEAGIPLVEGLRDLARNVELENAQRIIDDVRYRVESGSSLKEALSAHPRNFSNLYLALVGAGESTGKLTFALNSLAAFLEWQMDLKAKIREAATYPIILFVAMIGVVTLLVVRVIPVFQPMFEQMEVGLPLPTQIILAVSLFAKDYWLLGIGFLIMLFIGYKLMGLNSRGRYLRDSLKLKLPLFGSLIHKIILSRFCHILSLSIQSGVNVLGALDISIQSMGNTRLEQATKKVRNAINLGEKIIGMLKNVRIN